jgi:FKBP-type peptidyl-prolyl cis-trans isomerase SlyD
VSDDRIRPNSRVVLEYTLHDDAGNLLDASQTEDGEPIVYVHGYGMIVPGLESALAGLRQGATKEIALRPEEAFGEHDPELVLEVDRSDFPRPDRVKPGDEMIAESPDGDEATMRVVEVKKDTVVVDANHPLAGKHLRYAIHVREVRSASEAEIADAAAAFEAAGYTPAAEGDAERDRGLVQLRPRKS